MTLWAKALGRLKRVLCARAGAVAPLWAMALLALAPISAVVIDTTYAWSAKRGLQDALDSALLAVARAEAEKQSDIDAIAKRYLDANMGDRYGAQIASMSISYLGDGEYVGTVSAMVPSFFAGILGANGLEAGVNGTVRANNDNLDVVLSLDTTGSMSGARIAALKVAARDFVDTLYKNRPDNIRVGIVPFARYVNIGMHERNEPGIFVQPDGTSCGIETVRKKINKRNCVRRSEVRTYRDDGRLVSYVHEWEECDHDVVFEDEEVCRTSTWRGCVGSRPGSWSVQDDGAVATPFQGIMNNDCGTPLLRLTRDTGDLYSRIDDLKVGEETYLPAGLSLGWALLSHRAPFTDGAPPTSGRRRTLRAMVLMTDGVNTVSIWPSQANLGIHEGNSGPVADGVTKTLCGNIKSDDVILFTIAFDVTDSDVRNMLRGCATSPGMYFEAEGAGELRKSFQEIAAALTRLRLTD